MDAAALIDGGPSAYAFALALLASPPTVERGQGRVVVAVKQTDRPDDWPRDGEERLRRVIREEMEGIFERAGMPIGDEASRSAMRSNWQWVEANRLSEADKSSRFRQGMIGFLFGLALAICGFVIQNWTRLFGH